MHAHEVDELLRILRDMDKNLRRIADTLEKLTQPKPVGLKIIFDRPQIEKRD